MKRKFISLLLALALLLGMAPAAAFGEDVQYAAIASETQAAACSARAGGKVLSSVKVDVKYKDYLGNELKVYGFLIPAGTKTVELNFGENSLAYNYKANGLTWLEGYYDGSTASSEMYVGSKTKTVKVDADGDGTLDFIQVQKPFVYNPAGWATGGESKYAVTFVYEGSPLASPSENKSVSFGDVIKTVANTYAYSTNPWVAMSMKAYDGRNLSGFKGNAASMALATLATGSDEAIVKALDELAGFDPSSAYAEYTAPFVLMAYDAFPSYKVETARRDALVNTIVAALADTGGQYYSADTAGMLLPSLEKYYKAASYSPDMGISKEVYDKVRPAAEKAKTWLTVNQAADGSWSGNSNSTAMAVTALAAYGIDAHKDARFVKNNISAVQALLGFALYDASGFGHTGNAAYNELSTEQSSRALVAYGRMSASGAAYNIYTRAREESAAAAAPAISSVIKPLPISPAAGEAAVKVSFRVNAGSNQWFNKTVDVKSGVSVYDVVCAMLSAENGFSFKGDSVYISHITNAGLGKTLGEYSTGPNSGWLYKVNGVLPLKSMGDYKLKSGAEIELYYTDDYTKDPAASMVPGIKFTDVNDADWYASYAVKSAKLKLFSGYKTGTDEAGYTTYEFRGKDFMTRAMFAVVLSNMNVRLKGEEAPAAAAGFSDVVSGAWYEQAVNWAFAKGISAGKGAVFGANDPVSREQMATFVYSYARRQGVAGEAPDKEILGRFGDRGAISPYAEEALAWAVREGLMSGRGGGMLVPGGSATRGDVSAFMVNCCEYFRDKIK